MAINHNDKTNDNVVVMVIVTNNKQQTTIGYVLSFSSGEPLIASMMHLVYDFAGLTSRMDRNTDQHHKGYGFMGFRQQNAWRRYFDCDS